MAFSSLTNEEVQKKSLCQKAISCANNNHQALALPELYEFQTENEQVQKKLPAVFFKIILIKYRILLQEITKVQDLAKNSRFSVTRFVMSGNDQHSLGVDDVSTRKQYLKFHSETKFIVCLNGSHMKVRVLYRSSTFQFMREKKIVQSFPLVTILSSTERGVMILFQA